MDEACFGCMAAECRKNTRLIAAENSLHLYLSPGCLVETATPPEALFTQALAVLLPPAAGFIAGFLLVRALFPASGESGPAAAGVLCLGIAAFITYAIRKRFPPAQRTYVVKCIDD
jgi:hypothetical protein